MDHKTKESKGNRRSSIESQNGPHGSEDKGEIKQGGRSRYITQVTSVTALRSNYTAVRNHPRMRSPPRVPTIKPYIGKKDKRDSKRRKARPAAKPSARASATQPRPSPPPARAPTTAQKRTREHAHALPLPLNRNEKGPKRRRMPSHKQRSRDDEQAASAAAGARAARSAASSGDQLGEIRCRLRVRDDSQTDLADPVSVTASVKARRAARASQNALPTSSPDATADAETPRRRKSAALAGASAKAEPKARTAASKPRRKTYQHRSSEGSDSSDGDIRRVSKSGKRPSALPNRHAAEGIAKQRGRAERGLADRNAAGSSAIAESFSDDHLIFIPPSLDPEPAAEKGKKERPSKGAVSASESVFEEEVLDGSDAVTSSAEKKPRRRHMLDDNEEKTMKRVPSNLKQLRSIRPSDDRTGPSPAAKQVKASKDPKRKDTSDAKLDLKTLAGSRRSKGGAIQYDPKTAARKEKMARVEATVVQNIEEDDVAQSTTPLARILQFAQGQGNINKFDLTDKRIYVNNHFTLAIIPHCDVLTDVSLMHYLREHCIYHEKLLNRILEKAKRKEAVTNVFKDLKYRPARGEWKEMAPALLIPKAPKPLKQPPPLIEKTVDLLQVLLRLYKRAISGGEEVSERFFHHWYKYRINELSAKLALGLLKLWTVMRAQGECGSEPNNLVDIGIRLASQVFLFELRHLPCFPEKVEAPDLLINWFVTEDSFPTMIDSGFDYLSVTSGFRRDSGVAFIELVQSYFTSLLCPNKKGDLVADVWEQIKNPAFADELVSRDLFWTVVVNTPLQSALKTQSKIYEEHSDLAFALALLKHTKSCHLIFKSQPKAKDAIFGMALRVLKEMCREPLAVFLNIWEYKTDFSEGVTAMDLIKMLLTFGFAQRELISSTDATRGEYLDAIRELIMQSKKLAFEALNTTAMNQLWKVGPFGKVDSLASDCIPVKPIKTRMEMYARCYGFACIAWLVGSLGVSIEDGSREMSKANSINTLLSKFSSARSVIQLYETVLTIQLHLDNHIKKTVFSKVPGADGKPKKDFELIPVFSTEDRNNFAMVVEVIRARVCELKSTSAVPDSKPRVITAGGLGMMKDLNGVTLPHVAAIPALQTAVCSKKGYVHRDDDITTMKFVAHTLRDCGEQELALCDPSSDFSFRWSLLRKSNAYIGDSKDMLTAEERTVGQMCTCVPGVAQENATVKKRVACSNDMCENRMIKVECGPGPCSAGDSCTNRRLQKLSYAKCKARKVEDKGVGLMADEDIKEGALIGEYQGEILSPSDFKIRKKSYEGERHFYFMTLTKKLIIDASRRSQMTRFANHSCDPNAITEKWNAGGEPRIAIIALRVIKKGEEITFDYGARSVGNDSADCFCGSAKCRGALTSSKKDAKEPDESTGDGGSSEKEGAALKNDGKDDEEETERIAKNVDTRIAKAKRDIANADELELRVKGKVDPLKPSATRDVTGHLRVKLEAWKKSLRGTRDAPPKDRDVDPVNAVIKPFRIPRKDPEKIAADEARKLEERKTRANQILGNLNSTKNAAFAGSKSNPSQGQRPRTSGIKRPSTVKAAKPTLKADGKPLVPILRPGRGPSGSNPLPAGEPVAEEARGVEPTRRSHVGPVENVPGEKSPFMPTKTKFQKPKLRPKFQKRKRTGKYRTKETLSMEDYSTASSAEEEDMSHLKKMRRKKKGNKAASDDEFVAAPPVQRKVPLKLEEEVAPPEGESSHHAQGRSGQHRDNEHRDGPEDRQHRTGGSDQHGRSLKRSREQENHGHVRSDMHPDRETMPVSAMPYSGKLPMRVVQQHRGAGEGRIGRDEWQHRPREHDRRPHIPQQGLRTYHGEAGPSVRNRGYGMPAAARHPDDASERPHLQNPTHQPHSIAHQSDSQQSARPVAIPRSQPVSIPPVHRVLASQPPKPGGTDEHPPQNRPSDLKGIEGGPEEEKGTNKIEHEPMKQKGANVTSEVVHVKVANVFQPSKRAKPSDWKEADRGNDNAIASEDIVKEEQTKPAIEPPKGAESGIPGQESDMSKDKSDKNDTKPVHEPRDSEAAQPDQPADDKMKQPVEASGQADAEVVQSSEKLPKRGSVLGLRSAPAPAVKVSTPGEPKVEQVEPKESLKPKDEPKKSLDPTVEQNNSSEARDEHRKSLEDKGALNAPSESRADQHHAPVESRAGQHASGSSRFGSNMPAGSRFEPVDPRMERSADRARSRDQEARSSHWSEQRSRFHDRDERSRGPDKEFRRRDDMRRRDSRDGRDRDGGRHGPPRGEFDKNSRFRGEQHHREFDRRGRPGDHEWDRHRERERDPERERGPGRESALPSWMASGPGGGGSGFRGPPGHGEPDARGKEMRHSGGSSQGFPRRQSRESSGRTGYGSSSNLRSMGHDRRPTPERPDRRHSSDGGGLRGGLRGRSRSRFEDNVPAGGPGFAESGDSGRGDEKRRRVDAPGGSQDGGKTLDLRDILNSKKK